MRRFPVKDQQHWFRNKGEVVRTLVPLLGVALQFVIILKLFGIL